MATNREPDTLIVRASNARSGEQGEKLLARGQQMAMRLWEREAAGIAKPEHVNPYEYVAYVIEGRVEIRIENQRLEAARGDSYCIPANMPYSLKILEEATIVEATTLAN
jgi:quercetin dioxygenase-like cupin family protein